MRYVFLSLTLLICLSGCSNTFQGVKEDTKKSAKWTKEKVHDGAAYIKEKTE